MDLSSVAGLLAAPANGFSAVSNGVRISFELQDWLRNNLGPDIRDYMAQRKRLFKDPLYQGLRGKPGRGLPILAGPGLGGGDVNFRPYNEGFKRVGFQPFDSEISLGNRQSPHELMKRYDRRLTEIRKATGRRVVFLSHSYSGPWMLAVAATRPDDVACVMTLASPRQLPVQAHPLLLRVFQREHARRRDAFCSPKCGMDLECKAVEKALSFPATGVRSHAVYTKVDRSLPWQRTMSTHGHNHRVAASHFGVTASRQVFRLAVKVFLAVEEEELGIAA